MYVKSNINLFTYINHFIFIGMFVLELTVLKGLQHVSYFPLVLLNYPSSTRLRDFPGILTTMVLLFFCLLFSFDSFFYLIQS